MTKNSDIPAMMQQIGARAKEATVALAAATAEQKCQALNAAADTVWEERAQILDANQEDMAYGHDKGLSAAMLDRLALDEERLRGIRQGLRAIAAQQDPIGAVMESWERPSGLRIRRVRTPLGVVGVIYESRPNVTADAGALCLKAGNAVILRGGSESFHSSAALHKAMIKGIGQADLPETAIQLVPTRDRAAVQQMLTMTDVIDVIVPRGGKGLVGLIQREARVPVFAHLEGIVHIYIDAAADPEKAMRVVLNAKTRRTGICGAAECLLVHKNAAELGQNLVDALRDAGVEMRTEGLQGSVPASAEDWGQEFLDMKMAARLVDDEEAAIAHIRRYGSDHTDCIITEDDAAADRFFTALDSAILMRNASTQFADGGEFGMGAEIGIATGKMHARGPVGAEQLTSFKYLVEGDGTIRS